MELYVILKTAKSEHEEELHEMESYDLKPCLCFIGGDKPDKVTTERALAEATATDLRKPYGRLFNYEVCQLQLINTKEG